MPDPFYQYWQRKNSVMKNGLEERYMDLLNACKDRTKYFLKLGEKQLVNWSRAEYLDKIKYSYRNVNDVAIKKELVKDYLDEISKASNFDGLTLKKKLSLITWKYIRY